jgi:MOSC domain-containing protein YiiM
MDEIRPGLQAQLEGRRGTLCRVLEGGVLRRGDPVAVEGAPPARS